MKLPYMPGGLYGVCSGFVTRKGRIVFNARWMVAWPPILDEECASERQFPGRHWGEALIGHLRCARLQYAQALQAAIHQTQASRFVTQHLSTHLQRELRSDHAGETGAVFIYKGIATVAQWRRDGEMLAFARAHGATEAVHLTEIEHWLPASQRSWLLGPWRLAGWLTGALPALFGRRAVYGTIAAVETFVDQHYQQQIDHLKAFGGPAGLLPLLIRCQADEQHHRDESAALAGGKPHWLLRVWCSTVGWGSAAAVVLARRL